MINVIVVCFILIYLIEDCPSGEAFIGVNDCKQCDLGTYRIQSRNNHDCIDCPINTTSSEKGAKSASDCDISEFINLQHTET